LDFNTFLILLINFILSFSFAFSKMVIYIYIYYK
jgi:hypothetical protein